MTEYSEIVAEQTESGSAEPAQAEPETAVAAGDAPFAGVDLPHTADERVDEVLAGLLSLAGAPVADHVAIYDSVHRGLRDCLADLDHTVSGR
ncbi:MAG: hypothetical protein ACT4QF_09780 [Sporichthyaceae bacterium]